MSSEKHSRFLRRTVVALASLCLGSVTVPAQEIIQREPGLFSTPELTAGLDSVPRNRLVIRSADALSGTVTIHTAEQPGLNVSYVKIARTRERAKAYDFIDLISLHLTAEAAEARLVMRAPNPAPWITGEEEGMVDVVITVPINCFVEVECRQFDLEAVGPLSGLLADRSLGRLSVKRVNGPVELSTANARILMEDVTGSVTAATTNADLIARRVTITDGTGRFRNEQGAIRIDSLNGNLSVRNNLGSITIDQFVPTGESNLIRGNAAPVTVDIASMAGGQVIVSNKYADIELTVPDTLNAFYSLKVEEDGQIRTLDLPLRTELVQRNRLNLVSGKGTANIRVSIQGSGNILLKGVKTQP
ncbi:MAG: hypothetical protein D6800_13900 [Candidatus Zixiibacteriota bacterium]|nr:MAG: hypothetical protein D6800_13900 [candidate division Zixibacteria bacterium]